MSHISGLKITKREDDVHIDSVHSLDNIGAFATTFNREGDIKRNASVSGVMMSTQLGTYHKASKRLRNAKQSTAMASTTIDGLALGAGSALDTRQSNDMLRPSQSTFHRRNLSVISKLPPDRLRIEIDG